MCVKILKFLKSINPELDTQRYYSWFYTIFTLETFAQQPWMWKLTTLIDADIHYVIKVR